MLGFLALFGGFVQIPGLDDVVENFLTGSFLDSRLYEHLPSSPPTGGGLALGGAISLVGICPRVSSPTCADPATAALIERFRPLHAFVSTSGTSTSSTTPSSTARCSPSAASSNDVVERVVVQGICRRRDRRRPRRRRRRRAAAQSGFVRAYALLLIGGFAGPRPLLPDRGAWSEMIHVLLWLPLAAGLVCFVVPRERRRWAALLGRARRRSALAIALVVDFNTGTAGSSTPSTRAGSPPSACATSSASTGSASS